jgi:O-antigen ligase
MLHNYAFFVLLLVLCDTGKVWRRNLKLAVIAACLCIAYGILAAALVPTFVGYVSADGVPRAPTFFGRLFSDTRFSGSLNNPAYVAITLLFAIAFALYLALTSRWRPVRARWMWYTGLILFLLLFLVLTQTRGVLLGLTAGAVAFFAYLAFAGPGHRKLAGGGLLVIAALGVIAFSARGFLGSQGFPGQRLLHTSMREDNVRVRILYWGAAWRGFQERPLLGWGPENFATVIDRHFDPRLYVPGSASETWVDRAHSVAFDYLAETGVVGLAAYAALFAVFYVQAWRSGRRGSKRADVEDAQSLYSRALFFAVPVGYLVQALVFFDVLPAYLNLFLFLALGAYCFRCQD